MKLTIITAEFDPNDIASGHHLELMARALNQGQDTLITPAPSPTYQQHDYQAALPQSPAYTVPSVTAGGTHQTQPVAVSPSVTKRLSLGLLLMGLQLVEVAFSPIKWGLKLLKPNMMGLGCILGLLVAMGLTVRTLRTSNGVGGATGYSTGETLNPETEPESSPEPSESQDDTLSPPSPTPFTFPVIPQP